MSDRHGPDLFRFRKPSSTATALLILAVVVALDAGGLVPESPAVGWTLASVAAAVFLKGCVYRGQ